MREQLRQKLNAIPGIELDADAIDKRPGIPLSVLSENSALDELLTVLEWVRAQ